MKTGPPAIAIVGMACVYADTHNAAELWENVLAQRRAFRRLPAERLRTEDYWSPDRNLSDRTYSTEAAVIEGYEFDRVGFKVAGSTFRSADLAHWLALDVAAKAMADAGFPEGKGLPRETTGILLGNSLTGEFSRSNLMRLRWPYVRRVLESALAREGWTVSQQHEFLQRVEADYKAPFPPVGEETLAGGLSNTIAGRICNHFDLKGGGYTVDGACASSLLAVAHACSGLMTGDLDVALAGGVDLSLDPFELVGFAKIGALAQEDMRVFDRRSNGFWPGEGCGFVTLMRYQDALAQGHRVYAVIRGWGISSDGSGGITRPEANGQLEALRRAYRRAGFGFDTVMYCEGHGTGTAVGDATELEVLSRARRESGQNAPAAVIGSVKANIGHTKAAAGVAGLIKATMAVHAQVLPPVTACEQPHPLLSGTQPALRILHEAEVWPSDQPLRASVSGMGFGGINAHVVVESVVSDRRSSLSLPERAFSRSSQDAELFLFSAATRSELARVVDQVLALAGRLSLAEMADVAQSLQKRLEPSVWRAAIIASTPAELAERLALLKTWLQDDVSSRLLLAQGICLGSGKSAPRIGFLFPGQGSPAHLDGGFWRRRFEAVRECYEQAALPLAGDAISTLIAQPAVVTASLAALKMLKACHITAQAAVGHSLGEITALHWAGAFGEEALLGIARLRGKAMAELGSPTGGMMAIAAPWQKVQAILENDPVTVVGFNSPRQTVMAGDTAALNHLSHRARKQGWQTTLLPVSHAFHTPLVAGAVPVLADYLAGESCKRLERTVFSTVTGMPLDPDEDLRALLCRQVTSPVRFGHALAALLGVETSSGFVASSQPSEKKLALDLLIEAGPGSVLSGLVRDTVDIPVIPLDAGGASLKGLLLAFGAAFAMGAPVKQQALFDDRFTRPFALDRKWKFFANPCESAPVSPIPNELAVPPAAVPDTVRLTTVESAVHPKGGRLRSSESADASTLSPLELIRQLVANRAELPATSIQDTSRMLSDLHLNSITVGQLVSEAARRLDISRITGLTDFADATVSEMARALEELKQIGGSTPKVDRRAKPPGVDTWVQNFTVELVEAKKSTRVTPPVQVKGDNGFRWQVFAPKGHPFAWELCEKLEAAGRGGVLLCLPESPGPEQISLLLEAVRAVAALKNQPCFAVVQHGWGGSGFARTAHLEIAGLTTCVINAPPAHPRIVEWVVAEVLSATGFTEVHYDCEERRWEPRLTLAPPLAAGTGDFPIGRDDVLLVTGGGKGIAAECALALGKATGASLALMGRADPGSDRALAQNLERMTAAGLRCCYVRADVTDAAAVQLAVRQAENQLGPVTAFLHGAGTNTPQLLQSLDEAAFRITVAPKLQGVRNVLAAIDPARLRLLVTFGSIIARLGLRGEGDYSAANEWLRAFTEEFQARHPKCRCLALEWSVWSGVGMGERLGRIETLVEQGIMPIPLDEGVRILLELVQHPQPAVALVVTGRFGEAPTIKLNEPPLPLWRFLDHKRVHYPGVELIVDAELAVASDPYLTDHALQKQLLFPAVLGLEAMAQTAMALLGTSTPPVFEQVELSRPIAVSDKGTTSIRLAALRRSPQMVEVCVRCEETDFHEDHFRALCRFAPPGESNASELPRPFSPGIDNGCLPLAPEKDLYGRILFHQGRFCRVLGYRLLQAKKCIAEISPDSGAAWFGPYLPAEFVLGDPAARDAALHAIQACIPHQRILPTGIEQLTILKIETGTRLVHATERMRKGNTFIYDLEVTNTSGELLERWQGLHLRAVEALPVQEPWPEALLAPYLERRLEELIAGSSARIVLGRAQGAAHISRQDEPSGGATRERRPGTDAYLQQALGEAGRIWRRPDGKPMVLSNQSISAAHCRELTLAVASQGHTGCDLEQVFSHSETKWRDLLGDDRFALAQHVSQKIAETVDTSATRLWTVGECMKKAGLSVGAPLVLDSVMPDGWAMFRSGSFRVATCAVILQSADHSMVAAVGVAPEGADRQETATAEVVA